MYGFFLAWRNVRKSWSKGCGFMILQPCGVPGPSHKPWLSGWPWYFFPCPACEIRSIFARAEAKWLECATEMLDVSDGRSLLKRTFRLLIHVHVPWGEANLSVRLTSFHNVSHIYCLMPEQTRQVLLWGSCLRFLHSHLNTGWALGAINIASPHAFELAPHYVVSRSSVHCQMHVFWTATKVVYHR